MNCHEVGMMTTDLARRGALESGARESALAHLKQCSRCSARLADETRLTEGLTAWAASIDEQAPPRVEDTLRAAFRQRAIPAPRRRWVKFAAAGSIAAALLLFKLATPTMHQAPPVAKPAPQPTLAKVREKPGEEQGGAGNSPARPLKRAARVNPRFTPVELEVSTEFLPVIQGDGWTPLDGGQLVRVRLPRSAMGAFGLPVDERRARERVQADVMLSNDGLLRAIRFVR